MDFNSIVLTAFVVIILVLFGAGIILRICTAVFDAFTFICIFFIQTCRFMHWLGFKLRLAKNPPEPFDYRAFLP